MAFFIQDINLEPQDFIRKPTPLYMLRAFSECSIQPLADLRVYKHPRKKEDARTAIRLAVKKELRGKMPFSELDNLLKEVIEQAEGQYGDWPLEV